MASYHMTTFFLLLILPFFTLFTCFAFEARNPEGTHYSVLGKFKNSPYDFIAI